ncbi:MAG TPA: hypothetical protein VJQ57_13750 [Acidimicrobiia bacterium]|nr:hypothetical protein [Acidimicrobiia bacterium]
MTINSQNIFDKLADHALASGYFDRVNQHEPKNKPGRGLTCALWVDRIEPARGRSGLNKTDARVVVNVRVYTNMLQSPQDRIDPSVMEATDFLFEAYTGDFQLGAEDRFIDVLGMTQGHPLFAQSGYINIDNMTYRVMTITVPVIQENAWTQNP